MNSKDLLRKWISAFIAKDIETVMDCYADDAVISGCDGRSGGREGSDPQGHDRVFRGFPDSYSIVENIIADEDWAAWEWAGGGTFKGEFYGHAPTGRKFELRGCGFFNFKDGKIVCQRGYWDKLTWFAQVGLKTD